MIHALCHAAPRCTAADAPYCDLQITAVNECFGVSGDADGAVAARCCGAVLALQECGGDAALAMLLLHRASGAPVAGVYDAAVASARTCTPPCAL